MPPSATRPTTTSSSSRVRTSSANVWPAFHSRRSRRIARDTEVSEAGSSPWAGAALHGRRCVSFSRSACLTLPTSDDRGGRRTSRSVSRRVESDGATRVCVVSVMNGLARSQEVHRVDVDRRPHLARQRGASLVHAYQHAPEREALARAKHDAKPEAAADSGDGGRRWPLHDDRPRPDRLAAPRELRKLQASCARAVFVGGIDTDERRPRQWRVVELAAIAELAIQETVDVVTRSERDRGMIRRPSLDQDPSRRFPTARAPGDLNQQLKRPLARTIVWDAEGGIGVDHADERYVW